MRYLRFGFSTAIVLCISCQTPAPVESSTNADAAPIVSKEKKDRPEIEKQTELGLAYATDGLYREALNVFRKILKRDKSHLESHRSLGIIYVKVGRYKKAIKHLEIAIEKIKSDFEANYYLAEAYRTQDRYADAIFRYKIALTIKPKNLLATKALAWSYYRVRYYRAALSTIKRLEKKDREDLQATIIEARVLNKVGANKSALRLTKNKLEKASAEQKPYLLSVIGDIYLSRKEQKKAEDSYREALKDQPLLAGALLGLAKVLLNKGERSDIAVSYLERALRIKPGLVEALYYLGEAHKEKKPKLSRKYFAKFVRQASGDPEHKRLIQVALRDMKLRQRTKTAVAPTMRQQSSRVQ